MEMYHLINRGVEKREIVLDDYDRVRFIHDLYTFNDRQIALHPHQFDRKELHRPRKLLVHLHAFCLMGNHYHLLVSEAVPNGISLFMKKLNMGYSKYFNEKYKRSGALWQGKYKKKLIGRDAHFLYIPYYIHLNPLDFILPEWREGKVKAIDIKEAYEYLENYRWSSHLDYLGQKNFPSLTEREFIGEMLGSTNRYKKEITNIISSPDLAVGSYQIE